jgi:hypothetical protein
MNLQNWLKRNKTSTSEFGTLIGVGAKQVERYCLSPEKVDFRRPSAAVLERIAEVTGGKVTPNDFYDLAAKRKAA